VVPYGAQSSLEVNAIFPSRWHRSGPGGIRERGVLEALPEGSFARAELGATDGRGNSWFGKHDFMVPTNLGCDASLGSSAATNHVDRVLRLEAVRNGDGHEGFCGVRLYLAPCGLEGERSVPGGRTQTPLIIRVVTDRNMEGTWDEERSREASGE
jgi:hypothetical protein